MAQAAVPQVSITREHSILASQAIIVLVVSGSLGTLSWHPSTPLEWTADILLRTYLNFVAGAMAHEGTHGHLGLSALSNRWWGRLALLPTTVPYVTFRATHIAHHRFTNVPGKDPDAFLNTPHIWQFPLRAIAMPHHWLVWLWRKGALTRAAIVEYTLTYAVYFAIYAAIAVQVGWTRMLAGLLPAAIIHSFLLWYPFAVKTHEGYAVGEAAARSHNYRGKLAFWFSFGLSLHRAHHFWPSLGWLQMLSLVEPCTWKEALTFRRDIQLEPR